MGRIPNQFIDELLARTDIVEVINHRVPLKKAGREYQACCPFHSEKTPSFTVSPTKQFYHCFGCGAHGTAISFLMEYEHLDFVEAIETLAHEAGLEVPHEEGSGPGPAVAPNISNQYQALEKAAKYYQKQLKLAPQAVDYLKRRGLSGEIARDYGLGFAPDGWDGLIKALDEPAAELEKAGLVIRNDSGKFYDRFRNRIMFPIRDRKGQVIAFGGRVLDDGTPKYLNSPETSTFRKGQELYGLFEARQHTRKLNQLLIVEGYMDVIALAQNGIRYAVATLGTATTAEHIQRMFLRVPRIIFCFDGDRAGRDAAWKALNTALPLIQDRQEAAFLFLPDGEDPDSLVRSQGKEGFESQLQQAIGLSEFLIQGLKQRHPPNSQANRVQLASVGMEMIKPMQQGLLKTQILEDLAKLTHMHPQQLQGGMRPPRSDTSHDRKQQITVTPVRLLLFALLHEPQLAAHVSDPELLETPDIPGLQLVSAIVSTIREHPEITTATLLERWRNTPEYTHLERLLAWSPPGIDEHSLLKLFTDALTHIAASRDEIRLQRLIDKSEHGALTEDEKLLMKQLLSKPNE
jgi:DNA primase